ncbi:MAG: DUF484 family protein [Kangiellaceae bacterium]|jgi:uncharacterized protein YigA (DUF484 family)|nr:DUF484 family protein [Kangiellaceae bacterium]
MSLNEDDIVNYLADHPDFFEQNPQLLTHLSFKHDIDGSVSLVERQVKVLREKNRDLQGQLINMLTSAHTNEELLGKCMRLVLCLLDCNALDELTQTLSDTLIREFEIDAVSISLFGHWPKIESAKVITDGSHLLTQIDCSFPDNEPICGRIDRTTNQLLFPHSNIGKGSVAILPLGQAAKLGLLALLSSDERRFSPDMGSLFLTMISSVASSLILQYKDF